MASFILGPEHGPLLEHLFARFPESSLLMQSAYLRQGLSGPGALAAVAERDAGSVDGGLSEIAVHLANGRVLLLAPNRAVGLTEDIVRYTGRPVFGLLGPRAQVDAVREATGWLSAPTGINSHEDLMAVSASTLRSPAALRDGTARCRLVTAADEDVMVQMRHDFWVYGMFEHSTPALRENARVLVKRETDEGSLFVLETKDGTPVSTCVFTAVTPTRVQIGGVWTPDAHRNKGYAGAVVAGAVEHALKAGKDKSILFTGRTNHPAQAVYRRLGFETIGDYGIVLFHEPQRLPPL